MPTVFPSLIHVIFGAGFPVAEQRNVAMAPSVSVWSTGVVTKLGETVTTKTILSYQRKDMYIQTGPNRQNARDDIATTLLCPKQKGFLDSFVVVNHATIICISRNCLRHHHHHHHHHHHVFLALPGEQRVFTD